MYETGTKIKYNVFNDKVPINFFKNLLKKTHMREFPGLPGFNVLTVIFLGDVTDHLDFQSK